MLGAQLGLGLSENGEVATETRAQMLARYDRDRGTAGESPVHASDAVVSCSEKTLHGLKRQQGVEPVLWVRIRHALGLQIVILRGDQDVEGVRRLHALLEARQAPFRDGGLQEGRKARVIHQEAPWSVASRAQITQQTCPGSGIRRRVGEPSLFEGDRPQLHEKCVPGVALVRAKRHESRDFTLGKLGEYLGQRKRQNLAVVEPNSNQGVGEQVVAIIKHRRCRPPGNGEQMTRVSGQGDRRRNGAARR
ncbi:hypothetical protein D3C72_1075380 [compost metagenome]